MPPSASDRGDFRPAGHRPAGRDALPLGRSCSGDSWMSETVPAMPKSLWAATAPPPPPTVALAGGAHCDVAVVGAGFTGLAAALHLAEAGIACTVLEAAEIGFG